jgi:two-component system sensor histidine kinase DesK
MLEVRAVAHEALREARELARGYRTTDFAQELEGSGSLLSSAGIEVRLDVETMPRAWHEAAGWVVRESVTNVLRHSRAQEVEIVYADGRLRVSNDGARLDGPSFDGSGLRGLRERLAPLGASLEAGGDGDGRWVVVASLPGAGPLLAPAEPSTP